MVVVISSEEESKTGEIPDNRRFNEGIVFFPASSSLTLPSATCSRPFLSPPAC